MIANILTKTTPALRNLVVKRTIQTPPRYNSAAHLNNMSYAIPVMGVFCAFMAALLYINPFNERARANVVYTEKYQKKE